MLHSCSLTSVCIASVPYSTLSMLLFDDLSVWWVACFRLGKLLRFREFTSFFSNQRIVRRSVGISVLEIVKLLLILVGVIHFAGCLWLAIARLEEFYGADTFWLQPWLQAGAEELETYVDACFWATSTLTGIGFGDLTPITLSLIHI